LYEVFMHADEILGRCDVVIHEHHPVGKGISDPRCAGPDRKMVDEDVVRVRGVDEFAVISAQRFYPAV
jgi:hypothetical protein